MHSVTSCGLDLLDKKGLGLIGYSTKEMVNQHAVFHSFFYAVKSDLKKSRNFSTF